MKAFLHALQPCHVHVPGLLTHTGSNAAGEALTTYPVVVHAPGSYFTAEPRVAEMLLLQGHAESTVGPDYLRPLLAAVLGAASASEAALAALKAGVPVLTHGEGNSRFRAVRTEGEAVGVFNAADAPEPLFRLEQTFPAGRMPRLFTWRAGAVVEVPA